MRKGIAIIGVLVFLWQASVAQKDSVKSLETITIEGVRTVNGIGHLEGEVNGVIYEGKKNEVIITDSIAANKAINNTRQILGRIPGLSIVETESSGFTANGIATRGLNPTQSIEMNVRQNGYNISADVFGYNEAYYVPPMSAVNRVEFVRGAAALQFGPQFGGVVNYLLKEPSPKKPLEFNTAFTFGSFGLFNSYNSIGGSWKKWSYFGFFQYRSLQGYRPNSDQQQVSGFGKIQYAPSEKVKVGVEYSLLRNRIHMPGGLTDSLFDADPKASTRARNWLKSPWNILTGYVNYDPSNRTKIRFKTSYLFSNRSLVWRNEDGGPGAVDGIDSATFAYVPREVESEDMRSWASEFRIAHQYMLGQYNSTLAGGLRYSQAWFKRKGGGHGTTGSDFNLSTTGDWEYNLDFTTTNLAPFVENIFAIGDKLTITPGFRLEYLHSTVAGYKTEDNEKLAAAENRSRALPLFGAGTEFKATHHTSIYANVTQAYRPIDYSALQPFGVTSKIDPNLKDASGYNADLGYRGTIKNFFNFDISGFYMAYNNRIGVVLKIDPKTSQEYSLRTNIANSVHKGVESYLELNLLKLLHADAENGLSIFNSFAYTDAKYTSGAFKGKRVEASSKIINRLGLSYTNHAFSGIFQFNHTGDAFGDASNARVSEDPIAGYIPAYTVLDLSGTYKIKNYTISAGINNITDKAYFTRRTDEYPGPGIIPAVGRSFYIGLAARF
ncbi:MAG: TonB-dependent receptor [Niabella sp.]|nr:TonB-dependent receptor [Niabella sp.]